MTTEDKIQKILENADNCNYRIEKVIAIISNPNSPLSGGMANWLRKIGIDDPRIEPALDESLSREVRIAMFKRMMEKFHLNNQATAAILGCSPETVASYKIGRLQIPVRRLTRLRQVIDAIDSVK